MYYFIRLVYLKKKRFGLIGGYQMFHNYLRPHMGLEGKIPAQACDIDIQGDNKWITLIENTKR